MRSTQHRHSEETVDLDWEVFSDHWGRGITEDYRAAAGAEIEFDEAQLDEAQAVFPPRGRPSLSEPGSCEPEVVGQALADHLACR